MTTKIIAISNQKGGVGKTTSTLNIGAGLANLNKRVLLVDMDLQGSLTKSIGIYEPVNTIYELLKGSIKPYQAIVRHNNYDVLVADNRLAKLELEISTLAGREYILKEVMANIVSDYDYIFIDTPPALNVTILNAFTFASEIYIPVSLTFLSLQGLKELLNIVNIVKTRLNSSLTVTGIIPTFFDKRKILNKEVLNILKKEFKSKVFNSAISDNITLAEHPSHAKDIFAYNAKSTGAKDYLNLCNEIIKRG